MSYEISKSGRRWTVTGPEGHSITFATKAAAEGHVEQLVLSAAEAGLPTAEAPVDPASMSKLDRIAAMKAERAAVTAWKSSGEGEAPATPVTDWSSDPRNAKAKNAKAQKAGTGSTRAKILPEDEKAVLAIVVKARKAGESWEAIRQSFEAQPFRMTNGEPIGVSPLYLLAKRSGDVRNPEVKKAAAKGAKS